MTRPNLHARAVAAYQKGNQSHWLAALCARRIVGTYERGGTLRLAHDIARSADTVEDLARAGMCYVQLRRCIGLCRNRQKQMEQLAVLRRARLGLTYSHFAVLYKEWVKQEFDYEQALRYLDEANNSRWGTRLMDNNLKRDGGGGNNSRDVSELLIPVWKLTDPTILKLIEAKADKHILVLDVWNDEYGLAKVTPAKEKQ